MSDAEQADSLDAEQTPRTRISWLEAALAKAHQQVVALAEENTRLREASVEPQCLGKASNGDPRNSASGEIRKSGRVQGDDFEEECDLQVHGAPLVKGASAVRTLFNAITSMIGCVMYGIPVAFMRIGIVGAVIGVLTILGISLHCMYLLVDCRKFLEEKQNKHVKSYGDLCYYCFGRCGARGVDFFIVLTQTGICIAYMMIISSSMNELMPLVKKSTWLGAAVVMLVGPSWLRSLKKVAPISILAVLANVSGAIIVLCTCWYVLLVDGPTPTATLEIVNETLASQGVEVARDDLRWFNYKAIPFFFGMCTFAFEGIAMVFPVENSMKDRRKFKPVWGAACCLAACLNILLGASGYAAYREDVAQLITSNLPHNFVTVVMKCCLCFALMCTFTLMQFPVTEIYEDLLNLKTDNSAFEVVIRNLLRSGFVMFSAFVALTVPKFDVFISLVGASGSAALAFVFPVACQLKLRRKEMTRARILRDVCCGFFGIFGAVVGTISAMEDLREAMSL